MIKIQNIKIIFLPVLIFIVDRVSKILVIYYSNIFEKKKLYESKLLNLELVWNDGVAFGLLAFSSGYFYNLISSLIFIILIFLLYLINKSKGLERLFFVMIFSGALGNFYDRLIYNSVPDFIDLHINNLHWFIFNLADVFITLGVICLIIWELKQKV